MLHHPFPLVLEAFPLERRRDVLPELVDQVVHLVPQQVPPSDVERQEDGLVVVVEIMNVTAVVEGDFVVLRLRDELLDGRETAGPGGAGDEDVVPAPLHLHPEPQRLHRAVLPDDFASARGVIGGVRGEAFLRAVPPEFGDLQFPAAVVVRHNANTPCGSCGG